MYPIVERDAAFLPFSSDIDLRMDRYFAKKKSLLKEGESLKDFANAKDCKIFDQTCPDLRAMHCDDQVVAFERGDALYAFNFNPSKSFEGYMIPVGKGVDYEVVMSSDDKEYGGNGLVSHMKYTSIGGHINLYLPARTGIMLRACKPAKVVEAAKAAKTEPKA